MIPMGLPVYLFFIKIIKRKFSNTDMHVISTPYRDLRKYNSIQQNN